MPSFCAVVNCSDKYRHTKDISFHKFPLKDLKLLQKWKDFTNRGDDWIPSKWSSICSRHFPELDFKYNNERKSLRKDAVPTLAAAAAAVEIATTEQTVDTNVKLCKKPAATEKHTTKQTKVTTSQNSNATDVDIVVGNASKLTCRFCGTNSTNCVSFVNSFEIFGMIQKCLPTLQIQQNDALPNDMCRNCQEIVERFARFIDQVLETQTKLLQRQYRADRTMVRAAMLANNGGIERQLKIKQEPLVRVKQEVAEGLDCFFNDDLDMGMEDACEQEQPDDEIEQKFQFCDFPLMNTQDIINNCDIMEIVNLDDQFINIADDGDVTHTNAQASAKPPTNLLAATRSTTEQHNNINELLQTELLNEEHNYANPIEEQTVAQFQLSNNCKTEKPDLADMQHAEQEKQQQSEKQLLATTAATPPRSSKPIVTNVSQIPNPSMLRDLLPAPTIASEKLTAAAAATVSNTTTTSTTVTVPTNKHNVVVINDSIVTSSDAFKLHTCNICGSNFFTNESLSQHYMMAHPPLPMVSVPTATNQTLKLEANVERCINAVDTTFLHTADVAAQQQQLNYWQPTDWAHIEHNATDVGTESSIKNLQPEQSTPPPALISNLRPSINILDMQQSFMRPTERFEHGNPTVLNDSTYQLPPQPPAPPPPPPHDNNLAMSTAVSNVSAVQHSYLTPAPSIDATIMLSMSPNKDIKGNYSKLQRLYRQLKRKYRNLEERCTKKFKFVCQRCRQRFRNISELLQHKRTQLHFIPKPKRFSTKCIGCCQHFHTRLALQQHMRYICQSLPLRMQSTKLQTFKCPHCQAITFTHWRLYRHHAIKCKLKLTSRQKQQKYKNLMSKQRQRDFQMKSVKLQKFCRTTTTTATTTATQRTKGKLQQPGSVKKQCSNTWFSSSDFQVCCEDCGKSFVNLNCLKQHKISHTNERRHKCNLCERVFKRRHGLTQHIKGFHMQIKPHACPVCKHSYALKSDMLRCRHSLMRNKDEQLC